MFRNVVGIAVRDTRGLPAQEAALRIRAEPIDAVEVNAPLGPCCHLFLAHRMQRHTSAGIPGMILFVDSALPLPAGIPVGVQLSPKKNSTTSRSQSLRRSLLLSGGNQRFSS